MATISNVTVKSVRNTTAIAPNENYTVRFTVTNPSGGMSISSIRCNLFAVIGGKYYFVSKYGALNQTIAGGASGTYTLSMKSLNFGEACTSPSVSISGSNIFDYLRTNSTRSVTVKVMFVQYSTSMSFAPNEISISGLAAMRERINPVFSQFSFVRCDTSGVANDEGTRLLSTVKLSFLNNAYSEFTTTLQLYSVSGSTQTLVTTHTVSASEVQQLITGITNSTLFLSAFTVSTGTNYILKGTISSALESATASFSISKAFANMHLSAASNGGVAFGSFSSATNATPKFENSYPAYFYSSMAVSGGATFNGSAAFNGSVSIKGLRGGYVSGINSPASGDNRDQTYTVSFGITYTAIPAVMISKYAPNDTMSLVSVQIQSVSTTGFVVRIVNTGSGAHTVGFSWLAFGPV